MSQKQPNMRRQREANIGNHKQDPIFLVFLATTCIYIYTPIEALIMWQAQWEVRVDQVAKLGMVWGQQLEFGQQGCTKVGEK